MTAHAHSPAHDPAEHAAEESEGAPVDSIELSPLVQLGHRHFAEPLEWNPEPAFKGMTEGIGTDPPLGHQFFTDHGMPEATRIAEQATTFSDDEDGDHE